MAKISRFPVFDCYKLSFCLVFVSSVVILEISMVSVFCFKTKGNPKEYLLRFYAKITKINANLWEVSVLFSQEQRLLIFQEPLFVPWKHLCLYFKLCLGRNIFHNETLSKTWVLRKYSLSIFRSNHIISSQEATLLHRHIQRYPPSNSHFSNRYHPRLQGANYFHGRFLGSSSWRVGKTATERGSRPWFRGKLLFEGDLEISSKKREKISPGAEGAIIVNRSYWSNGQER